MGDLGSMLILFAVLFGAMYFFMIRPEKKRREEKERFLNALKAGDKIVTVGGIIGEVVSVSADVLTINVGQRDKMRIRIIRGGVLKRYEEPGEDKGEKAAGAKDKESSSGEKDKEKGTGAHSSKEIVEATDAEQESEKSSD